jgi:hypothetical protein
MRWNSHASFEESRQDISMH